MRNFLSMALVELLCFLATETAFRLYFWYRVGPDLLFYGTDFFGPQEEKTKFGFLVTDKKEKAEVKVCNRPNVQVHSNQMDGYSKYLPNQKRRDSNHNGGMFDVTINSHGFRGAEFNIEKEPGTYRIVTLGAQYPTLFIKPILSTFFVVYLV